MRFLTPFLVAFIVITSCGRSKEKTSSGTEETGNKDLAEGKALFAREDCGGCHAESSAIIGPSFRQLAAEYESSEANISHLAYKVIIGVKPNEGIWGSREMTPHPQLKREDAEKIVKYMLSFPADPNKPFLHNTK